MNFIIRYVSIFILFSFIGWLMEVIYRSYNHKHFINPGFMVGIMLPIYGCGAITLYSICNIEFVHITNKVAQIIIIMSVSTILMTVIEFICGYISLKVYNNRLWDYSDRKFNFMGIICPTFSIIWGVCAGIFYFLIMPWIDNYTDYIINHSANILLLGFILGVFVVDFFYSLKILEKIRKYSLKIKQTIDFESLKQTIKEKALLSKQKVKGISIMKFRRRLSHYLDDEEESDKK